MSSTIPPQRAHRAAATALSLTRSPFHLDAAENDGAGGRGKKRQRGWLSAEPSITRTRVQPLIDAP
jgi:hypothetical protein